MLVHPGFRLGRQNFTAPVITTYATTQFSGYKIILACNLYSVNTHLSQNIV